MKIRSSSMGLFSGFFTIVDAFINGEIHGGEDSLRVTSPDSIKGTYDSAIGSFGIPQYGGSMAGSVVYPKDNQKGCKEFDESGISFKSKSGAFPTIFLLVEV
jgi:hypothetical protein